MYKTVIVTPAQPAITKLVVLAPEVPEVTKKIEVGPGWLRAWCDIGRSGASKWYDNRIGDSNKRRDDGQFPKVPLDTQQDPAYLDPSTRPMGTRAYLFVPPDVTPQAVIDALNGIKPEKF